MNDIFTQFKNFWSLLGINQKVSIGVALVGVIGGIVGLLFWAGQPKLQLLYSHMEAEDVSQVVSLLESRGISYEIGAGGSSIMVPHDKVYSLRMDLAGQGIPAGGNVGFEIFDESNFGVSDFVQKTNYMRALQGELARTISQLQGVKSARVMISVPENRLLAQQSKIKPTSSVFVDTGGASLSENSVNSIRFLVANSVEGLNVDDVAVVDNKGTVLSEGLKGDGSMVGGTGHVRFRQNMEEYYANKIETMLSKVVGRGNVVARVSVNVESDTSTIVEERFDPTSQVIRKQTVTEDVSVSDDMAPLSSSGDAASGGKTQSQPVSSSKDTTKKKSIAYEISRSTIETIKAPGAVKDITAAVFIAQRYNVLDGNMSPSPRSKEEMDMIQRMVVNALGIEGDKTVVKERVTIQEIPFVKEEIVDSGGLLPAPVFEVLDIAKRFSGIFVALVMFMIFLKLLKSSKPKAQNFEYVPAEEKVDTTTDVTPRSTVELINELVKQKPENVSTALRNWVQSPDSN